MSISWDAAAIALTEAKGDSAMASCSGLALGIIAARDIKEGDVLCTIPKSACISLLTTSLADIIKENELGGGLGLVIAVLHEASLGAESPWAGYFAAMPRREYIPGFWTAAEVELLKGTELADSVNGLLNDVKEDFETLVAPLVAQYPDAIRAEYWTLENFHFAASLVASRAFGIDDDHGDGMVPLADVFNHKVSVVDLASEYAVHGASSSSGSSSDDDDDDEEEESEEEEEVEEESEEENKEDAATTTKTEYKSVMRRDDEDGHAVHAVHGITQANGLHLALEIAIMDADDDTLQIVAVSDVAAGQEVHNTYGEIGNDGLVKKYGFALRENPFTTVTVSKEDVVEACRELFSAAAVLETEEKDEEHQKSGKRQRRAATTTTTTTLSRDTAKKMKKSKHSTQTFEDLLQVLETESSLLDTDEDGDAVEPFELLSNGHINAPLFATLRVLCSSSAAVSSLKDALTVDLGDGGTQGSAVLKPERIGSVQVWNVVDRNGKYLFGEEEIEEEHSVVNASTSTGNEVCCSHDDHGDHTDCQHQHHTHKDDNTSIVSAAAISAMVTSAMCSVLEKVITKRLNKYPSPLNDTLKVLKQLENELKGGRLADGEAAKRAALTLAASEQEVLHGVLVAAAARKTHLMKLNTV